MLKIRLQRHGKKGKPFFHIVIAESTSKRDGKFIESIGSYSPTSNPAKISLDVDKSVKWLENGAQPTNTVRAILSYKGALLKKHLNGGVKKGAFTQEEAEKKFEKWLSEKEESINTKIEKISQHKEESKKNKLEAEKKVSEARVIAKEKVEDQSAETNNGSSDSHQSENHAENPSMGETSTEEVKE